MNIEQSSQYAENYHRNGFLSPVSLIDPSEAASCRAAMEVAEKDQGPLHYISKIHRVFSSAALLALNERVLDVVEALIGPDIMLFDVTYIVKEPGTVSHVSWHQDLTY